MNNLKFDNPGVLHMYQSTLAKMQESYTQVLTALTQAFGNNLILSGCVRNGSTISDGVVIINSEVMNFTGGNVIDGFKIAVNTVVEKAQYNDGIQRDFYTKKTAGISMAEGEPFSNFVVLQKVSALQSSIAQLSSSFASLNNSIAQHLRASNPHNVTKSDVGLSYIPNALSDSYTENNTQKLATAAAVYSLANRAGTVLYTNSVYLGDVGEIGIETGANESRFQIIHNIGHTNYIVVGNLTSSVSAANWMQQNDVMFVIGNKQNNSFEVWAREVAGVIQNLRFDYVLIKLY